MLDRRPPEADVAFVEVDLADTVAAEAAVRQVAEERAGSTPS